MMVVWIIITMQGGQCRLLNNDNFNALTFSLGVTVVVFSLL